MVKQIAVSLVANICFVSWGQTTNLFNTAPTYPASSQVNIFLADAKLKRARALKARFEPVFRDLDRRAGQDPRVFYCDAIGGVFFANNSNPQREFREWLKRNKDLVNDKFLGDAMAIASTNLRAQLLWVMDDEAGAVNNMLLSLDKLGKANSEVCKSHLLHESLSESLLYKFYKLDPGLVAEERCYAGPITDAASMFRQYVAPWYQTNKPLHISEVWDKMIAASVKIKSIDAQCLSAFRSNELPGLLIEKSDSLVATGDIASAVRVLQEVLSNYPESPKFLEAERKLRVLVK